MVDDSTTGLSGVQAQQRLRNAEIVVDTVVRPCAQRPVAEVGHLHRHSDRDPRRRRCGHNGTDRRLDGRRIV
ncbi:hypothetical protein [Gordonia oryzae]|uniref:hypothetical protein n=1 Tax=Gordonia oryzae TaxID=2487349 RepID=UPI003F830D9B